MCNQRPCDKPGCTYSRSHAITCEARWLLKQPKEYRTEYLKKPMVLKRSEELKIAMLSEWGRK
jgi:hypothetical protein